MAIRKAGNPACECTRVEAGPRREATVAKSSHPHQQKAPHLGSFLLAQTRYYLYGSEQENAVYSSSYAYLLVAGAKILI